MVGFKAIAKPHRDILRGIFTADTYAAKLGNVVKKEGPLEYKNPKKFFEKTYMTEGLKGLLSGVEGRLKGRARKNQDPIIQLKTPFGGGKTHTLIALYHKASEWNCQPVVIVGSEIDVKDTFWSIIENQLTGQIKHFKERIAPGTTSITKLFSQNDKPVLILMDEVLQYLTRASGVSVNNSTLADQTLAFMLSLTEAVASCQNVVFLVTLQESEIQPLANRFPLFTKLLMRMRRMVTPVNDDEISSILRKRLFSEVNEKEAKKIVQEFTNYAKNETILPLGIQASEFQDRFEKSYPFLPEVIDVLYERWGSFPDFQRTRGVLRLLSHVVHSACGRNLPYITLSDFDLANTDIREELLEHIDEQYRSVIASDLIGPNAGVKVVDKGLGDTYRNLDLGTRTATAIFLYSFSGSMERGAVSDEIKRSATHIDIPAATIDTAVNQLSQHLFFLRVENDKSYFDTQPNLARIMKTWMENVDDDKVTARMSTQLKKSFKSVSGALLQTCISPKTSREILDTPELKLIVFSQRDDELSEKLLMEYGDNRRVYKNTLFFLIPLSGNPSQLETEIRKTIAYENIQKDSALNLSDTQKNEVSAALKSSQTALNDAVRHDYRTLLIPTKEGVREVDLGIPAHGLSTRIDEIVFDVLRSKEEILETIGERIILMRYLKDNDTVSTSQLYYSSLRTPGEPRVSRRAWISGIHRGVENGLFGLGEKENGMLILHYFKNTPLGIALDNNEVIIHPDLIRENIAHEDILHEYLRNNEAISTNLPFQYDPKSTNQPRPLLDTWKSAIREGVRKGTFGLGNKVADNITLSAFMQEPSTITLGDSEVLIQAAICTELIVEPPIPVQPDNGENTDNGEDDEPLPDGQSKKTIGIRFRLPHGKVSNVAQHLNQLQSSFQNMQLELKASEGEISEDDYAEFKDNLRELDIEIEEL